MTYIGSYSLLACPICRRVHKRPRYASVSIHIPRGINDGPDAARECMKCKASFTLGDMVNIGDIRKSVLTSDEVFSIVKNGFYKRPDLKLTLIDRFKKVFGLYQTGEERWDRLLAEFPEIH